MSAKSKAAVTAFRCTKCGRTQPKWLGRCPECNEWNTFEEVILNDEFASRSTGIFASGSVKAKPVALTTVDPMEGSRLSTGIKEFDRVLGGGVMKRSAVLVGGEPGIGKSTLLLQVGSSLQSKGRVLYVSGEESAGQIRMRSDRLGLQPDNVEILCTARLEDIESALNALNPVCVIIDSIQTVYSVEAGAVPSTINQLKYCAHELVSWVKERDSVLFIVAHVTKEGTIAGPKALEHLVDTVISFEKNDEDIRFLRALKNRFGSVDELGIFFMSEKGLQPFDDPSGLFLVSRSDGSIPAGVAVVPVFEGSRAFMVEIQALTVPAKASFTRVFSEKIDSARISRVAAVLEKRIGIKFSDQDIYINVAGGIRLSEPALDLALAAALYSARADLAVPAGITFVGELSLAGEVRPVARLRQRSKAAAALGFTCLLAPAQEDGCRKITSIHEAMKAAFASGTFQHTAADAKPATDNTECAT